MLTRAYLRTKLTKKLNRNLTEEDCSQPLKFYCRSQLRRREWAGRDSRRFAKEDERSLKQT